MGLHLLRGKSNAGDHKGLVKIPRIFLAPPLLTSLAHVLDKSALYGYREVCPENFLDIVTLR
jgi:hypothetical protein